MKIQELWINVLLFGLLSDGISCQNIWNRPIEVEHRSGVWDFKGLKGHDPQDLQLWGSGDSQVKNVEPQNTQQSRIDNWGPEDNQRKDHRNLNFPKDSHVEIGLTSPEIIVSGWKQLHEGASLINEDNGVSGFSKLHFDSVTAAPHDNGAVGFNQLQENGVLQTHSGLNPQSNEDRVRDGNIHQDIKRWKTDENQKQQSSEDRVRDGNLHQDNERWKTNENQNQQSNEDPVRDRNIHQGNERWKSDENQNRNEGWQRDELKQHSDGNWKANVNQHSNEGWARNEPNQQSDESFKTNINQRRDDGWSGERHKQHEGNRWNVNVNQPHGQGWTGDEPKQQESVRGDANHHTKDSWTEHDHQHNEDNFKIDGKEGWRIDENQNIDEDQKAKISVNKQYNNDWTNDEPKQHIDGRWKTGENQYINKEDENLHNARNPTTEKKLNSGIGWTPEENQKIPVDNWAPDVKQQIYNRGWTPQENQGDSVEKWSPEISHQTANGGWTSQEEQKIPAVWAPEVNHPTSENIWTPLKKQDIPADGWKPQENRPDLKNDYSLQKKLNIPVNNLTPEVNQLKSNNGWTSQEKQNIPLDNWTPEGNQPISNNGWTSQEKQNIPLDNWTPEGNQPISNNGWASQEKQNIPLDNWTPEISRPVSSNGWTSQEKQNVPLDDWTPEANLQPSNNGWTSQGKQEDIPLDNWPPEINKPASNNGWTPETNQPASNNGWTPEINQPSSNNGWTPQEKHQISHDGWTSDENQKSSPGSWISDDNIAKNWTKENKNEDKWREEGSRGQTNTNSWHDGNIKQRDDWPENGNQRNNKPDFSKKRTEHGGITTILENKPINENSWNGNSNNFPASINAPSKEIFPDIQKTFIDENHKFELGTIFPTAPGIPEQGTPNDANHLNNDDPNFVLQNDNFNEKGPKGDIVPTESPFKNQRPQGNYKGGDGTYYGDDANIEISYTNTIPGTAGIDYPDYTTIPNTVFECKNQQFPGYFADIETGCQVYHVCQSDGRHNSFLCPTGTIFNQKLFTCDWWHNYDCTSSAEHFNLNQMLYHEGDAQGNYKGSHYSRPIRQNFITGDIQESMRQNRVINHEWSNIDQTGTNVGQHHGQSQGWDDNTHSEINTEHNYGQNPQDKGWTNDRQSGLNIAHNDGQDQRWTDNGQIDASTVHNDRQDQGWINNEQIRTNTEYNPRQDQGWTNSGQNGINAKRNHGQNQNNLEWTNNGQTGINTKHSFGQDPEWTTREQGGINTEHDHQGLNNDEQARKHKKQNYGHNEAWTDSEQTGLNSGLGWTESSNTGENFGTKDEVKAYGNLDESNFGNFNDRKNYQYHMMDDPWNIKRQDTELWDKRTDEWNSQSQEIEDNNFNEQSKDAVDDISPITESGLARSQNWKDEAKSLDASVKKETGQITSPKHVQTPNDALDIISDSVIQGDRSNFDRSEEINGWIRDLENGQISAERHDSHLDPIVQENRSKFEERHKGVLQSSVEYSSEPKYLNAAEYSDLERRSDDFPQKGKHKIIPESTVEYTEGPSYIERRADYFSQGEISDLPLNDFTHDKGITNKTELDINRISQMNTAAISDPASLGEESLGYGVSDHMSSVLERVRDENIGHKNKKSSIEAAVTSAFKPETQKSLETKMEINSAVGRIGKGNDKNKSTFLSTASESETNKYEQPEKSTIWASKKTSDIFEPITEDLEVFDSELEKNSRFETAGRINSVTGNNSESAIAQESRLSHALVLASSKYEANIKPEIISQSEDHVEFGENHGMLSAGDSTVGKYNLPSAASQEVLISEQNDFISNSTEGLIEISKRAKLGVSEVRDKLQGIKGFNFNVGISPQIINGNLPLLNNHDLANLHHNWSDTDYMSENKEISKILIKTNLDQHHGKQTNMNRDVSENTKDNSKSTVHNVSHQDAKKRPPVISYIQKNGANNQLKIPGIRTYSKVSENLNVNSSNHPRFNFRVSAVNRDKLFQALRSEASNGYSSTDAVVEDGDLKEGRKTTFAYDAGELTNSYGQRSPKFNLKVIKIRRNKALKTSNSEVTSDTTPHVDETTEAGNLYKDSKPPSIYHSRGEESNDNSKLIKFIFKIPSGNKNEYSPVHPIDAGSGMRPNFAFSRRTSES